MINTLYKQAILIREFELRILELFDEGILHGTTHTCIGQELIPVSVMPYLTKDDIVISNHRSHGHYIARTGDVRGLLAELMGLPEGICQGRGGSQHLCNKEWNFYSNGVQGNMFPVAAGMAYAQKLKGNNNIVVCFIGDGTLGQGVVYETLNLVSLYNLPMLVIVENNYYAQSTETETVMAGSFTKRIEAFGLPIMYDDHGAIEGLSELFRVETDIDNLPSVVLCHTSRLAPHSKGDDYRTPEEMRFFEDLDWYNEVTQEQKDKARQQILTIEQELRDKYEI